MVSTEALRPSGNLIREPRQFTAWEPRIFTATCGFEADICRSSIDGQIVTTDEEVTLDEQFIEKISGSHPSIKDYLGYIMLDFSLVDGALEQIPFGWAFQFAETIQLTAIFEAIVKKELQLSDKKLQQHKQKTMSAWYKLQEGEKEQVVLEGDASL